MHNGHTNGHRMRDPPPVCRQIPPQLQWTRVVVVTCTTCGSSACHLCNCNKNLIASRLLSLHVRPVGFVCLFFNWKQTSTVNASVGHCMKDLQPPPLVRSQFQKELAVDVVRSRQWGLFVLLSQCKCHRIFSAPNSTKKLQWMWVAITSYTIQALSPLYQFFNWKKTSIVNVSVIASTTRGSSALFSTTHVAVIACTPCGCTTRGSYACLLCNSKNTCSASRLLSTGCCGTACMTCELCLTVLQWKQTSTVNVRAGHCMYAPWPPSIVSSPTPKRTCSVWRLLSYRTQAIGSGCLSVCSSTEICGCKCHRMYDAWVLRLSSLQLKRILAVQAVDCHCMYHPWPLFSCSSTESKLSSTVKASAKLAVSVVRLSLRVHEKKIAEMWKWWQFFPWFLRSSSSRFSKSAISLSLLHMAPFPAAPVSQFDRRMLDKISLQATEREHMTRQQGLWKPTTTLTPALNADSIPRKKFFVFLVASAIEVSWRRKTVSFTSSIPLESDKKNAHGQRRAISVWGTSFHSETGLGLWLKRKPFPHLRTEARSKRNRRVPIETRRGPIEATARQASVRESHSRICNPKHGANETRRVLIETRPVPIEATARLLQARSSAKEKAIPTSAIGSTEQTFSSECQTGNAPPSQLQCRHEGRQNWPHAKQSIPSCEPQGPDRERRPKWRLPQCSQLPVWTQNDQFFASLVENRLKRKKRLRLELDSALAHFRVNGRLATFPAAVSSRSPPFLAARWLAWTVNGGSKMMIPLDDFFDAATAQRNWKEQRALTAILPVL